MKQELKHDKATTPLDQTRSSFPQEVTNEGRNVIQSTEHTSLPRSSTSKNYRGRKRAHSISLSDHRPGPSTKRLRSGKLLPNNEKCDYTHESFREYLEYVSENEIVQYFVNIMGNAVEWFRQHPEVGMQDFVQFFYTNLLNAKDLYRNWDSTQDTTPEFPYDPRQSPPPGYPEAFLQRPTFERPRAYARTPYPEDLYEILERQYHERIEVEQAQLSTTEHSIGYFRKGGSADVGALEAPTLRRYNGNDEPSSPTLPRSKHAWQSRSISATDSRVRVLDPVSPPYSPRSPVKNEWAEERNRTGFTINRPSKSTHGHTYDGNRSALSDRQADTNKNGYSRANDWPIGRSISDGYQPRSVYSRPELPSTVGGCYDSPASVSHEISDREIRARVSTEEEMSTAHQLLHMKQDQRLWNSINTRKAATTPSSPRELRPKLPPLSSMLRECADMSTRGTNVGTLPLPALSVNGKQSLVDAPSYGSDHAPHRTSLSRGTTFPPMATEGYGPISTIPNSDHGHDPQCDTRPRSRTVSEYPPHPHYGPGSQYKTSTGPVPTSDHAHHSGDRRYKLTSQRTPSPS